MASRLQRRLALRRKLHILRTITCSKSVKKSSIIMDAFLHICMLKLKLEAIKRELSNLTAIKTEYLSLLNHLQPPKKEVKVEKAGKGFLVKVICEKKGDDLVSILEVFEEMGLIVLQARISSKLYFSMEAIVAVQKEHALEVKNVKQAVIEAIGRQSENGTEKHRDFP